MEKRNRQATVLASTLRRPHRNRWKIFCVLLFVGVLVFHMVVLYQWFFSARRIMNNTASIEMKSILWQEKGLPSKDYGVIHKGDPKFDALIEALACDTETAAIRGCMARGYKYNLTFFSEQGNKLADCRVDQNLVELRTAVYSYDSGTWRGGNQSFQVLESLSATNDIDSAQ
ncbi:MAG: hypothetical protein U9N87_07460 [Planctomycetota bacterium]|nr:hypothetical protein [Planctomycetota bacterium]